MTSQRRLDAVDRRYDPETPVVVDCLHCGGLGEYQAECESCDVQLTSRNRRNRADMGSPASFVKIATHAHPVVSHD